MTAGQFRWNAFDPINCTFGFEGRAGSGLGVLHLKSGSGVTTPYLRLSNSSGADVFSIDYNGRLRLESAALNSILYFEFYQTGASDSGSGSVGIGYGHKYFCRSAITSEVGKYEFVSTALASNQYTADFNINLVTLGNYDSKINFVSDATIKFFKKSSIQLREVFTIVPSWIDNTDATRKGKVAFNVYDTSSHEFLAGEASGSAVKIGVFGVSPVVRASALVQTYSTADRTLSAYTADNEGSAYSGIDNLQVGNVYAQLADLNALRTAYENLRAFTEDLAGFVNSLVDDMQAYGLEQ